MIGHHRWTFLQLLSYYVCNHDDVKSPTSCLVGQKMVDFGDRPIEGYDSEAMVCSIHDQVLAHDSQTDEAEVTTGIRPRRSADIDAGQTGATVSQSIYQQSPSILQAQSREASNLMGNSPAIFQDLNSGVSVERSWQVDLHCFVCHLEYSVSAYAITIKP